MFEYDTESTSKGDVIKMYTETLDQMRQKINTVKKKAQTAMRVTLWLKLIVALVSIGAIGSWLKDHGHKEVWAAVLILGEVADVLLDNLPYFQQRIELPKMKLKLEDIELGFMRDLVNYERGAIEHDEAIRRYFIHRESWVKAVG